MEILYVPYTVRRILVISVYPGSFDPITLGHIDIATRASNLFDKVYLAVVDTRSTKSLMFDTDERVSMCKGAFASFDNIEVIKYSGLTVDLCHELGATVMVRGLRMGSDFDYEFEMALNNQKLAPEIDTMYLMASLDQIYIKSSLIKEIASARGRISHLVPSHVADLLIDRYGNEK